MPVHSNQSLPSNPRNFPRRAARRRPGQFYLLTVAAALLGLGTASGTLLLPAAHAQAFTFTDVLNSVTPTANGILFAGAGSVSLNGSGLLSFYAKRAPDLAVGIYTLPVSAAGSTPAAILADTMGTGAGVGGAPFTNFGGVTSLNNSGTVAFLGTTGTAPETYGVYSASGAGGGPVTTIASGNTPGSAFFSVGGAPAIDGTGRVVFYGLRAGGGSVTGLYSGTGGPTVTIADTSPGSPFSNGLGGQPPVVNSGGTVAFAAVLTAGGNGIFARSDTGFGPVTAIADTNGVGGSFTQFGGGYAINEGGTVAFSAQGANGAGIYVRTIGSASPASLIADTNGLGGPFFGFINIGINGGGQVAFRAYTDANQNATGIFTKLGGSSTVVSVIRNGDTLFGSTVTDLDFWGNGLNDAGQIAFNYTLGNGRHGVAVAVTAAPEPSDAFLLLVGLAVGIPIHVSRRRRMQDATRCPVITKTNIALGVVIRLRDMSAGGFFEHSAQ